MAEELSENTNKPEPRKFKDRVEYLAFIAEQKALKDKETKPSNQTFEEFNAKEHFEKNNKEPKEQISLKSVLTAINLNIKISNQILAKLNQKAAKESLPIDDSKILDKLASRIDKLTESVKNIRTDQHKFLTDRIHPVENTNADTVRPNINTTNNNTDNVRPNIPEERTRVIESRPQYNITNVRQYQYKRRPTANMRRGGTLANIGGKVGTYIGGRALGNVIAKSIRVGERVTGKILKAPFRMAGKVLRRAVGARPNRNTLVRANRMAETSKFRKKMLDLLGIISKKDRQNDTTTQQNTQSKGMSPLAIAAGIGAAILGIKALVDNMSKETKDKIKSFLYDIQEKMKDKAAKAAYEFQEYIKKWLYDNNPLKEFGEKLGAKIYDFVSMLNGFGEKLGSKLFDIVNGIESTYKDAKEGVKTAIANTYNKAEEYAGKAADTAMNASTAVYKTITGAPDNVANMVKNSPPAKWLERKHNDHVANSKMPDYVSGMKDSNKFAPNKEYTNLADSLNQPKATPTLKQLESKQKQSDKIEIEKNKKAAQPIIVNQNTNTKETSRQTPNIVRLGTRNLDSSNMQLQRTQLIGSYIGTGFLVN